MKFQHLKTFENFKSNGDSSEVVNEFLNSGKKAYKRTVEFLEGDSEEAKEVKELFDKLQEEKDKSAKLGLMKKITMLGAKWAKVNKMDSKDYSFKQIQTVIEKDFDRAFKGGTDVTIGESVEYQNGETFTLGDETINGIKINDKIRDEELHEYSLQHRESLVDELMRWITETSSQSDKYLMKEDLVMLMGISDEYILSSNSTNSYLFPGESGFEEACKEILEINEKL